MSDNGIGREEVTVHLEKVLASGVFRQAERSARLLRFLVERTLDGQGDRLKEYTVGVEALGRGKSFDPRTDPIVRAEASRLRSRLERYYAGDGELDAVVIDLPKGAYTPRFLSRSPRSATPSVSRRDPRSLVRPLLWGGTAVLGLLLAFVSGARSARSVPMADEPATRMEMLLQSDEVLGSEVGTNVVISPDGRRAVFVSIDSSGATHLRALHFDGSAPIDLPGTRGGRAPFWSPDSRWIAFWAAGQLRKLAVDGGSPVVLCEASELLGGSWSDDGTIVAALDATGRLFRVDASSGGTPIPILDLSEERTAPRWPQVLPGGQHVLYTAYTSLGVDQARIEVLSLTDGTRRVVMQGGTFARYVAPQHLTFINQGTLFAAPFDLERLELRGEQVPILDDVSYSPTFGDAQISFSRHGTALYRRGSRNGPRIVALVDSVGRTTPLLETPGQYGWPALSSDGQRLAVSLVESGVTQLSVYTDLGKRPRRLWTVPGIDAGVWTRDGSHLVARGPNGIVWMPAHGGEPRTLIDNPQISVPWTFARGDRQLAFAVMDSSTVLDLWLAAIERTADGLSARNPVPVLRTRAFETYPAISRDGRWLAYTSTASGVPTVYVRPLAVSGTGIPIAAGVRVPRWSRVGQRLFFTTIDHRLMVLEYSIEGGRFVPGTARQWTPIALADNGVLPSYDVGTDDRHVVALLPARSTGTQATNHVTLLRGLHDAIRSKAQ